eukprot:symbB.v1.2.029774.t1/scaffold3295.1/size59563/3
MVKIFQMDSDQEDVELLGSSGEEEPATTALAAMPDHQCKGSIKVTPKIPPTFDGVSSWFEFEELIDEWVGITTLSGEKLGPSLKNSLVGAAEYYKNMLDNSILRDLWRFMQLFHIWRGSSGEFVQWIARFEVASKRVLDMSITAVDHPEFGDILTQQEFTELANVQDDEDRRIRALEIREEAILRAKSRHKDQFPLSDNLMSLIFLVQADLNEQQRERFVASMSLRQIDMMRYSYLNVKSLFLELFFSTATSAADPQKRTTFLVLDEGEYEEEQGYWVMDQETQEEGFVSLYSEGDFWVLSAKGQYSRRRIAGRKFRRPGKGKGKGKSSGRRRPGFRSRRGKGAFATDDATQQDWTNSSHYGKGKGKGKGKGYGKPQWNYQQNYKGKGPPGKDANKGGHKGRGKGKPKGDAHATAPAQSSEPSQAHHTAASTEEGWGEYESSQQVEAWYLDGSGWRSYLTDQGNVGWYSGTEYYQNSYYVCVISGRTDGPDRSEASLAMSPKAWPNLQA